MAHCISEEAEKILDKEFKVLNSGFVRLVDYMGNDSRIVQSARVSYGEGTKSVREDKGLIDYLLRNEHTSPFEQVIFTFHVKLPIFIARQWIRHRTARLNEISGRYSILKNEFYVPDEKDIAFQSKDNKQGRAEEEVSSDIKKNILKSLIEEQNSIYKNYQSIIDLNIARELARINLPLSTYTEWYWQIDLHNLFHFLKLRLDKHAQKEIRDYSKVMFDIAHKVCPLACESFENHILGGCKLSKKEKNALKGFIDIEKLNLSEREIEILKDKLN